jgi:3-deoxy-D-manno-octulosonic-acid transferase
MYLLYTLCIAAYTLGIYVASLFSAKARLWVAGRKHFPDFVPATKKRWWFHCASLGEFEQARPVIEAIRQARPDIELVLSFFSPSGYEVRKNYAGVDRVFYLPSDLPYHMKRLVKQIRPDAFFLVKYELWLNLLRALHGAEVPCYLFSGVFREGHWLFSAAGFLGRQQLIPFKAIWVQDRASILRLEGAGMKNVLPGGDTRFDRVLELARRPFPERDIIKQHAASRKIMVAGSVWAPEITHLLEAAQVPGFFREWMLVIAPHELSDASLSRLKDSFSALGKSGLWSRKEWEVDILLIDTMGDLGKIYGLADVAMVGGGFGKGIHNILEPAVYGVPVLFGPAHQKALEAAALISAGGAFEYRSASELKKLLQNFAHDDAWRGKAGEASRKYVQSSAGASSAVLKKVLVAQ